MVGTFALNTEGVVGGLLLMVNHGISTGALFLLVAMIYKRCRTRRIAELGGLQKPAPVMAGVFLTVTLSSIGLPGLNGFVGEFLILLGAFMEDRWRAAIAAAGVVLASLYLLWAYQRVFHGPTDGANVGIPDMNWREGLLMAPFLAAIVFMGVYPKPAIDRMQPAVDALLEHVEAVTVGEDGFEAPAASGTGGAGPGTEPGADADGADTTDVSPTGRDDGAAAATSSAGGGRTL